MQNARAVKDYFSYPSLVKVEPKENYFIEATFSDGVTKKVDIKPYFQWKVFQPLENLDLFNQAHADYGAVVWNEKIDIAQEALYDKGVTVANSN